MPPPAIVDPTTLDFSNLLADREEIMRVNPHRHEFVLLDGVVMYDMQRGVFAGFYDVRTDAWWVRAHIPGRPLFPGALMIESAAQLSSYLTHYILGAEYFVGLAGVERVKYRGPVAPPCRFVIVGRMLQLRARRTKCETQGFVDGTMVFEATLTGMAV